MIPEAKFQIGKSGLTSGIIDSLVLVFKNHKRVRISTLKSLNRNRESIKTLSEEICLELEKKTEFYFDYTIIGFTIIMGRHPKIK
jgi:RNA-binding protein YhbY